MGKNVARDTDGFVLRNGTPSRAGLIVRIAESVVSSLCKHVADLLVKCGGFADLLLFLGRKRGRVELVTERAGKSNGKARIKRCDVSGLVVGRSRNVRAHRRHRINEARAVLYPQALDRIGVIARPYLRHIVKHTRIESSAAARAGLEQNVGEFRIQALEHRIKAQIVTEINLALIIRAEQRASRLAHIAVEVPLNVGNAALTENLSDRFVDIIANVLTGKVENKLISSLGARPDFPEQNLPSFLLQKKNNGSPYNTSFLWK